MQNVAVNNLNLSVSGIRNGGADETNVGVVAGDAWQETITWCLSRGEQMLLIPLKSNPSNFPLFFFSFGHIIRSLVHLLS